jgi:hypothetical protein
MGDSLTRHPRVGSVPLYAASCADGLHWIYIRSPERPLQKDAIPCISATAMDMINTRTPEAVILSPLTVIGQRASADPPPLGEADSTLNYASGTTAVCCFWKSRVLKTSAGGLKDLPNPCRAKGAPRLTRPLMYQIQGTVSSLVQQPQIGHHGAGTCHRERAGLQDVAPASKGWSLATVPGSFSDLVLHWVSGRISDSAQFSQVEHVVRPLRHIILEHDPSPCTTQPCSCCSRNGPRNQRRDQIHGLKTRRRA